VNHTVLPQTGCVQFTITIQCEYSDVVREMRTENERSLPLVLEKRPNIYTLQTADSVQSLSCTSASSLQSANIESSHTSGTLRV